MGTGGRAHEQPGQRPSGARITSHGLYADIRGSASAPVLLYLHGGPGQGAHEFMALQGERLGRELRVIGLDQRGAGRSAPLPGGSRLTVADLIADCEDVRRALGIENWAVLGQSFGGALALRYALACPGSVTAVVFENPLWDMALTSRAGLRRLAAMLARRGHRADADAARSAADTVPDPRALRAAYVRALDALGEDRDAFFLPDQATRRLWRRLRDSRPRSDNAGDEAGDEAGGGHHEAIVSDEAFYESLLPEVGRLTAPALLIRGGQDPVTSTEQEQAFRHASSRNEVLVFQRAGHFVHADEPGPYAQAVTAFLRASARRMVTQQAGSPGAGAAGGQPAGGGAVRPARGPGAPRRAPAPGLGEAAGRGAWSETLRAEATDYARVALANIRREFPSGVRHTMTAPGDFPHRPRARTPVFYGSYDWHSCVEMHWTLVRLLRVASDEVPGAEIRAALRSQFNPVGLAAEAEFIAGPGGLSERPYGWGWALALYHEISSFDDPDARQWAHALTPLADTLTARFLGWLPKATYPVRCGTHPNSAFGLSLVLPHARRRAAGGSGELLAAITGKAHAWYGADTLYPGAWEPSGQDFLSPALTEAELMAQLLPGAEFGEWLAFFLPGVAGEEPAALFTPVTVSDPSDGQIAHLHGLNASRAWCWRRIAESLPAGDPRAAPALAAARRHAGAALPQVIGEDYMVEHWLACYAVLLLADRERAVPA